ncbi:MAG: GNAT family N-acetyltransferase [Clostridia bacterium]|nr:GNAT family N-acetyltransferase [Clostridia bacterium]
MTVVPYNESMKERLRYICRCTGPLEAVSDPDGVGRYITDCYCDYYLECEPGNCFALLDDAGTVMGYTLSAPDYKRYRRAFAPYLRRILANPRSEKLEVRAEQLVLRVFSPFYPAHLHIDLLDEATGQGGGTQLMNRLLAHLKAQNVPRVMLIVGSGNKDAIRFYRRFGFRRLIAGGGGTVMGLKL